MLWFVSKEIDDYPACQERRAFYSDLTKIRISPITEFDKFYRFDDGRKDNRCMIIGHTDTAFDVIDMLRNKSAKKYKFYISVCIMYPHEFFGRCKFTKGDSIFINKQDLIIVEGRQIYACKFSDETGFGFKSTDAEMSMFHSDLKGFHHKLDNAFMQIK